MKRHTPSTFVAHLERRQKWLNLVLNALRGGERVLWGMGEREGAEKMLKELGVTVITRSRAERMGYKLRASAKPIGTGYFGSPIKRDANLYILECHFDPPESAAE